MLPVCANLLIFVDMKKITVILFVLLLFAMPGCFDAGNGGRSSGNDSFSFEDLFGDEEYDEGEDASYPDGVIDGDDYDIGDSYDEPEDESFWSGLKKKIGGINVFTIDDDIAFGRQCDEEISSSPSEYPILSRTRYASVYRYLEEIRDNILSSDKIENRDNFEWKLTIIDDDVLNAFVTPGGYIYFYTGLLKYTKSEAEVAGVMAHEIAHADRRHSTQAMTKEYGVSFLISIVAGIVTDGEDSYISDIVQTLAYNGASLSFSRKHEYEADEYSVRYLNSIRNKRNYQPTAIVDFFDRMKQDSLTESNGHFEFLMTHPYDDNRKENIYKIWNSLGSPKGMRFENNHEAIVSMLP